MIGHALATVLRESQRMLRIAVDPLLQRQQEVRQLLSRVRDTSRDQDTSLPHHDHGWWDDLSYDEQVAYLRAHRKSRFKITKSPGSNDTIELTDKQEGARALSMDPKDRASRIFKNHQQAVIKNIESTEFKRDAEGKLFAELKVGDAAVKLDPDDWKQAVKQRLRLERDPNSGKMVLKGERFEWRVNRHAPGMIDENEKYRVLWGSLFGQGLKNPRMEPINGDPYDLRRSNVIIRTYDASAPDMIKRPDAGSIDFKRRRFTQDGLTVEAPGYTPKISIDNHELALDGYPDVDQAIAARDLAQAQISGDVGEISGAVERAESTGLDAGNIKRIRDLARYGTPDRADEHIRGLESMDEFDRGIGEEDLLSLVDSITGGRDGAPAHWQRVYDLIDPQLPDGIGRADLDEAGITPRDLLDLHPTDRGEVLDGVREIRDSSIPPVMVEEALESDAETESGDESQPPERRPNESLRDYTDRVAGDLYRHELEGKRWTMPERYDWLKRNMEIFNDYSTYMGFMGRLRELGDQLYREDKGGARGGARKAIHIPIMVYPPKMDPQDTKKHMLIFRKHKFRDMGSMDGSHHLWQIPGIYGRPTIDHHKGGYSPATGRSFGPQAGFDLARPEDGFHEKKHYDMLRRLGYSSAMDRIWEEHDERRRLGISTGTDLSKTAGLLGFIKRALEDRGLKDHWSLDEVRDHIEAETGKDR